MWSHLPVTKLLYNMTNEGESKYVQKVVQLIETVGALYF